MKSACDDNRTGPRCCASAMNTRSRAWQRRFFGARPSVQNAPVIWADSCVLSSRVLFADAFGSRLRLRGPGTRPGLIFGHYCPS